MCGPLPILAKIKWKIPTGVINTLSEMAAFSKFSGNSILEIPKVRVEATIRRRG
jgi:hypothetical protein